MDAFGWVPSSKGAVGYESETVESPATLIDIDGRVSTFIIRGDEGRSFYLKLTGKLLMAKIPRSH